MKLGMAENCTELNYESPSRNIEYYNNIDYSKQSK